MNQKDFEKQKEIIREKFGEPRKITCITPKDAVGVDDGVLNGGDIFATEDGEIIYLDYHLVDFDVVELAKYIELAENLYEKYRKKVNIFLICPRTVNVSVRECPIKSDSDFSIKLYCSQDDPCEVILEGIKSKIRNNALLTRRDISEVEMLPVICNRKDRNYYRVESLRIINEFY